MPDPVFNQSMQAMVDASGGLLRRGGNDRTTEEQIALRKKNGCPDVWTSPASACRVPTAIPGRSWHQHGFAEDVIDAATGKVVQSGSAADRWLAANAGRFGLHRPVGTPGEKGWEPWHIEPVNIDRSKMGGFAGDPDDIGFDMDRQGRPGNPENELTARLDAVMAALGGGAPSAEMAATVQPATSTVAPADPAMTTQPGKGGQVAGKGVGRWKKLVEEALTYVGEPVTPETVALTLRRMQQESGGDPDVVNNWDSNAKKGTPSIGLMQVILPTFNSYAGELRGKGQTDPFANLVASMRYAKARYGSLSAAYSRKEGY